MPGLSRSIRSFRWTSGAPGEVLRRMELYGFKVTSGACPTLDWDGLVGGTPLSLDGFSPGKSQSNIWMTARGTPLCGNPQIIDDDYR